MTERSPRTDLGILRDEWAVGDRVLIRVGNHDGQEATITKVEQTRNKRVYCWLVLEGLDLSVGWYAPGELDLLEKA